MRSLRFLTHYISSVPAHRGFSVSTDNRVHVFKPVSVQAMWWVILDNWYSCGYFYCSLVSVFFPFHLEVMFFFGFFFLTGQPSSHSIKPARWPVVITTFQAACSSPGSATIRAGSPPTRPASTSGTPCRTCSHTVPTLQFSSLTCK